MKSLIFLLAYFPALTYAQSMTSVWTDAGYAHPEITAINLYPPSTSQKATHQFNLTVVVIRNTGWTKDLIEARYQKVAKIYAQCGVRISNAKLVQVDPPNSEAAYYMHPGTKNSESTDRFGERIPEAQDQITVIHVRDLNPANTGISGPEWEYGENHPLLNKEWISIQVTEDRYQLARNPSYSPEAHEIGHSLLNCEHLEGSYKNLMMGNKKFVSGDLTPAQCEIIRSHELVHPI